MQYTFLKKRFKNIHVFFIYKILIFLGIKVNQAVTSDSTTIRIQRTCRKKETSMT